MRKKDDLRFRRSKTISINAYSSQKNIQMEFLLFTFTNTQTYFKIDESVVRSCVM